LFVRNGLAGMLGLNERQVRVNRAPLSAAGFGPKIMMFLTLRKCCCPWLLSMKLKPPRSNGIEDRLEHFFATTQRGSAARSTTPRSRCPGTGRILGH